MATLDISQCKINIFQALLKSFMLSVANSLWYDSDGSPIPKLEPKSDPSEPIFLCWGGPNLPGPWIFE